MDLGFILCKPSLVTSLVLIVYAETILSSTKDISPFTGQFIGRHNDGDLQRLMDVGIGSVEREFEGKIILQPAPCIWAVLACCAPTNFHFRFGCFPYLGCSTLFWLSDPCQFQIVMHAAEEAVQFYRQFGKRPTGTHPTPPAVTTYATTTHPQLANSTTPTQTPTLAAETDATTQSSDSVTTTLAT